MNAGTGIGTWILGFLPQGGDVPDWLTNLTTTLNSFLAQFAGLGVWAPWALLGACATTAFTVWGICAVFKLGRAVASYVPFIGGAG